MLRKRLALSAAAAGALLLAGCGRSAAAPAPSRLAATYSAHGLSVALPPGWRAAGASLTPNLVDPREVLAVATFPLRYRAGGCAQVAVGALAALGRTGAFLTLQERGVGSVAFPPRPATFGPGLGGRSEATTCVRGPRFEDHWLAFADGRRNFYAEVAFGPHAAAATRRAAWRILDGLRVDPSVRPTWRSSG
jgi:hypothetical protein